MIDACVIEGLEKGIQIMEEKGIKQIVGEVFAGQWDGTVKEVCALGALALGLGIDPIYDWDTEWDDNLDQDVNRAYFLDTGSLQPKLLEACPALSLPITSESRSLFDYIFLRNDGELTPEGRKYQPTILELLEELKSMEIN